VYDGLGRNTSIPAIDSPNNAGVISVGYRLNDQVASITQNGATTAYSFDGLGRRVTETTGSNVVTKHYTGSSDNPAWSTNTAGVTDIYVSSLGTGLNSTVTLDNGVKTLSLDVNDLRGNTVTRINVDTASTDSWVSFDEYGNRDAASTGKLVTYDAYGQYERATTSQGLILMGARLYNPITNQFTSPDPITGGNETTYTYPNDPINKNDFSGLEVSIAQWFTVVTTVSLIPAMFAAGFCALTAGLACSVVTYAAGAVASFMSGFILARLDKKDIYSAFLEGIESVGFGALGGKMIATIFGVPLKYLKSSRVSSGLKRSLVGSLAFLQSISDIYLSDNFAKGVVKVGGEFLEKAFTAIGKLGK
jgi:RHS repeat-associated protein